MVENAENPIRNSTRGFCRKGGIIYIIVLEFPVNQPNLRFYFNLGAIHGRCKMWYGKVSGNISQTVYKTGEKFGTKASSCHIPALRRSKKTFPMFPIIEHTVSGRLWRGLLIVTNEYNSSLLSQPLRMKIITTHNRFYSTWIPTNMCDAVFLYCTQTHSHSFHVLFTM